MYFEGATPLPRASYLGYAKVAQVFRDVLSRGQLLIAAGEDCFTPGSLACHKGHMQVPPCVSES